MPVCSCSPVARPAYRSACFVPAPPPPVIINCMGIDELLRVMVVCMLHVPLSVRWGPWPLGLMVGGAWDRWRCRQLWRARFCGREGRACRYALRTGRAASPARLCWAPLSPPFSPVRSVLTLTIHRRSACVGGPRSNGGGGSEEEEEGTKTSERRGASGRRDSVVHCGQEKGGAR